VHSGISIAAFPHFGFYFCKLLMDVSVGSFYLACDRIDKFEFVFVESAPIRGFGPCALILASAGFV
jgi:hypothetical protein